MAGRLWLCNTANTVNTLCLLALVLGRADSFVGRGPAMQLHQQRQRLPNFCKGGASGFLYVKSLAQRREDGTFPRVNQEKEEHARPSTAPLAQRREGGAFPRVNKEREEHPWPRNAPLAAITATALVCAVLPLAASAADGGVIEEDKRVMYTAIYAVAHLPIIVPFLLFWKVDRETKIKGAAIASPFFVGWIALLGGWLRF